jgi:hypothetical protein
MRDDPDYEANVRTIWAIRADEPCYIDKDGVRCFFWWRYDSSTIH